MDVTKAFMILVVSVTRSPAVSIPPDCPPPPRVEYGLIVGVYQRAYKQHSRVTYACHEMYSIKGDGSSTCVNGEWRNVPTCERKRETCGNPQTLQDGYIYQKTEKEVTYRCNSYFTLSGSRAVHCIDGYWSELPICLKPCRVPSTIDPQYNIERAGTTLFEHGKTAYFYCKHDFKSYVDQRFMHYGVGECHNGQIKYPLCQKVNAERQPDIAPVREPEERIDTGQTCGPPLTLQDGDIVNSNQMEVRYQCNRRFKLRGSARVTCVNGQWSALPTCLKPCVVPKIIDAKYNLQNKPETDYIEEGSQTSFVCKTGFYALRENRYYQYATGTCRNGIMVYPTCYYY